MLRYCSLAPPSLTCLIHSHVREEKTLKDVYASIFPLKSIVEDHEEEYRAAIMKAASLNMLVSNLHHRLTEHSMIHSNMITIT
ncbi:unnamed protein product [Cochlearia groenlandica]